MSKFLELFEARIFEYWEITSERMLQQVLDDILHYANSNPAIFKQEFEEIRFDKTLTPIPIVIRALSKDMANWGQFYIDLMNDIFTLAKQSQKPNEILIHLMDFAYLEKEESPFIQKLTDRLYYELNSENIESQLVAIQLLPDFMDNNVVQNKLKITDTLHQLLNDRNWKVRVVAFGSLESSNLLRPSNKLSLLDKLFKLIFGSHGLL